MGEAVLRLESVVTDCADPERLADFYGELLGTEVSRRPLASSGWHRRVMAPISLAFQKVPDPTPGKNRLTSTRPRPT